MISEKEVRAKLRKLRSPIKGAVDHYHIEVGKDGTGDDAIWVWCVIKDEHLEAFIKEDKQGVAPWDTLRDKIYSTLSPPPDGEPLLYLRLRVLSEVRKEEARERSE